MAKKIGNLELHCFKGATTVTPVKFDSSKNIVLIFGESGSGKSTLIDAIDFLCNKTYGSLDQKSVGSKKHELITSIGKTQGDLKVILGSSGQIWNANIVAGKPKVNGPEGCPTVSILRKQDILRFIDGQPKERYEKLKNFIAVPNCEKNERTLREAIKGDEDTLNEAARSIQQAEDSLEKLWEAHGKSESDSLSWAKDLSGRNTKEANMSKSKIESFFLKKQQCDTKLDNINNIITKHEKAKEKLKLATEDVIGTQLSTNVASLVRILQTTQEYLKNEEKFDKCPVCETKIDMQYLKTQIGKRLESMKKQIVLLKNIDESQKDVDSYKRALSEAQQSYTSQFQSMLDEIFHEKSVYEKETAEYSSLWENRIVVPTFETTIEWQKKIDSFSDKISKIKSEIEKDLTQITSIKIHGEVIEEKKSTGTFTESRLKILRELLTILESERKAYIDSVLTAIATDVDKLYLTLHPNEGIGGVNFKIDPDKQGSLDLGGTFLSFSNILPQAYYSEAHLDTLGICIFLALAKYYNFDVIILDDVLTSADQVHMTRFIRMIYDESSNFNQIIITTHYRPWHDAYRYSIGPVSNVQLIQLLPWTINRGIQHTKTKICVDELKEYLRQASYDRQLVSSKAGILLEALLDNLTLKYRCKVPRQVESSYTLGDLFASLNNKLKDALVVEKIDANGKNSKILLGPLINSIASISWIRNKVGCHFSISGMEISDSDITTFVNGVINFADSLICSQCGCLSQSDISGSYWDCGCGGVKLQPHAMPS